MCIRDSSCQLEFALYAGWDQFTHNQRKITVDTFFQQLSTDIEDFVSARDWQQFHSPKNLSMALSVEAAELVEHFQWLTPDQSEDLSGDQCQAVGEELADILIYTLMVAMRLGIDLEHATVNKMKQNQDKYPVEKARRLTAKYTEL